MKTSFSSLVLIGILSLFFVSCGSGNFTKVLNSIEVSTVEDQSTQEVQLSFTTDLNLGNMSFPAISLPIMHPKKAYPIGQLDLVPALNNKNQLKVSFNVTQLADLQVSQAVLPNGNPIPMIASNQVISVNIGSNGKLYFAATSTGVVVGLALPIKSFDGIGRALPGINFFPVNSYGKINATAGLFTSAEAGKNGLAIVADFSKAINPQVLYPEDFGIQAQEASAQLKLSYASQVPSSKIQTRIVQLMYALNAAKTKLQIVR